MQRIAKFFSFLFHPLLLPTYAFLFINWTYPYLFIGISPDNKVKLIVTLFTNTFVFPMITVVLMRKLNFINSIYLKSREERIIPYIAISLFYFWTFMVVKNLEVSDFLTNIMLGASISVFMAFFLNLFFKISIHSVGAGNFVALTLFLVLMSSYNLEWALMVVIIIAGIIGSARLYLKAHLSGDVFLGYIVGFLGQVIAFKFIQILNYV